LSNQSSWLHAKQGKKTKNSKKKLIMQSIATAIAIAIEHGTRREEKET
jgi:hypothetical protein